ncbi:mechanosensitive ion channel [Bacillus sp. B-jedd]|uniref:mechanosensitive ion channel n=1 Tax=Bacillus sp. B-jedd TaxID=1476857 RepID=UPI0005156804|nr:mechanosensitive ion channel [Bacillus sp. B-jedd]CEG25346.1 putative integral inner membrane protein [Bacillus sp. B-jedd]
MDNNYQFWSGWDRLVYKIPDFLLALAVLLIGWFIAKAIEKGVYKALQKSNFDNRLFSHVNNRKVSSEKIISKIIYYILLVFVFILFFNILGLHLITGPLIAMLTAITAAIPSLLKAALILAVAWLVATGLSYLIKKGGRTLKVHQLSQKLNLTKDSEDPGLLADRIAKVVFYLVLLMFLPGVLAALNIQGISGPFSDMLGSFLAFIPKLFSAALIILVGWFIAKIVRDIVTNLLQGLGLERLVERFGLKRMFEGTSLSSVIGTIVFVLILIPTVIAALERLDLKGISGPAINMLNDVLTMIPNIVVAIVMILAGIWIGRWVNRFVTELLDRAGFNGFLKGIGIGKGTAATLSLSKIVGTIAQVLIVLLFTVEALNLVGLDFLVTLATGVIAYLPNVLAAIIILMVGLWIGNFIKKLLASMLQGPHFGLLSSVAKYAVIAISVFMALDQLGVAASIVNAAFILTLGGLALAFGLSFGLGGREFASKYLARFDQKIEQTTVVKPPPGHAGNLLRNQAGQPDQPMNQGGQMDRPMNQGGQTGSLNQNNPYTNPNNHDPKDPNNPFNNM